MSDARHADATAARRTSKESEPLMDAAEVGRRLGGIDPSTVHRYARAGRIGFVAVGRKRKFREKHVQAYLDDNDRQAIPAQVPARHKR